MKSDKNEFPNPPRILIVACLTLFIGLFSTSATDAQPAEGKQTYQRTFEVKVEGWTQQEMDMLSRNLPENIIKINETCPEKNTILIGVDASHPKRIEDIQSEIREIFDGVFAPARIDKIKTIPHQKTVNYCK